MCQISNERKLPTHADRHLCQRYVCHVRKIILTPSCLSLIVATMIDVCVCVCCNLANVPVGWRKIVVCYSNKARGEKALNCKVMLEYVAMCVHLSVLVGDSTFIFWWVFDCARMNRAGRRWERYQPFDPSYILINGTKTISLARDSRCGQAKPKAGSMPFDDWPRMSLFSLLLPLFHF